MKRIQKMRKERNLSLRQLGALCDPPVCASYICYAEHGLVLGNGQAGRIADALGWVGDPSELFEEVPDGEDR